MSTPHFFRHRAFAITIGLLFVVGAIVPALTTAAVVAPVTTLIVLPDDGREPFIDEIEASTHSVDLYLYLLSDEEIILALLRAHHRGVDVRVMLEPEPYGGAQTEYDTWRRLNAAGVAVRWSPGGFRFSHVKLMVVDQEVALIMNLNMTGASFIANREFAVLTTDEVVVDEARRLFNADWEEDPSFVPEHLVTSPDNSRAAISALLMSAESTIDIAAEVFTDAEMLDLVAAAVSRGVRVRVIVAALAGSAPELEEPGFLARAGVDVRILKSPYMHAKAIIVDGEVAFIGSQNLTANSLDGNREVGIVVNEDLLMARLVAVFESDAVRATPIMP